MAEFRFNCVRATSKQDALQGYKVAQESLAEAEGRLAAMQEDRSTIKADATDRNPSVKPCLPVIRTLDSKR